MMSSKQNHQEGKQKPSSPKPGSPKRRVPGEVTSLPSETSIQKRRAQMPPDFQIILMPLFANMTKITDNLFLTGVGGMTKENFQKNRITCIINATIEAPNLRTPGVESIRIAVDDTAEDDLSPHFDAAADKVNEITQKGGRTVIHCVAGVSRSSALVIAYLIKYRKLSLRDAYNYVHRLRQVVRPNNGFFKQLIEFEKKVGGKQSVKMINVNKGGQTFEIPDFFEKEHPRFVLLEALKAKAKQDKQQARASPTPASSSTPTSTPAAAPVPREQSMQSVSEVPKSETGKRDSKAEQSSSSIESKESSDDNREDKRKSKTNPSKS